MLWVPQGGEDFSWMYSSISATRPAASLGTTHAPGTSGSKAGSYTEIVSGANCARDVFGLFVNFNSNNFAAENRNTTVDIGVDPSGGSSYTILIPDLFAGNAAPYQLGGHSYYFPIWIKAGSSIGIRAATAAATARTLKCFMQVYGSPRNKAACKVGTKCKAYGVSGTGGVAVTSGTASEGSWTSLAASIAEAPFYWEVGLHCADTTMMGVFYHADLGYGDGSNKRVIVSDKLFVSTSTSEQLGSAGGDGMWAQVKAGGTVYGRLQCSGTADSSLTMAAWGVY